MSRIEYYNEVSKKYNMTDEKRNFVIIGSPNHGNMGDVAITWSTIKFLEQLYPDDNVFDITMDEFPYEIDAIFHLLKSKDVIILQGGGNLGNMYPDDEMIRRYVISRFRNNRLIIFPQLVYFTDDSDGKKELEICARLYSDNKNLYMLARDKYSFCIMTKYFKVLSARTVDVVLSQKVQGSALREGAMICLRGDKESILSDENKKDIVDIVSSLYSKVVTTDTVIEFDGNKNERFERLADKLDAFQNAEIVITDRLHGLIFSVITSTPCVVLPTVNTKIISAFEDLDMATGIALIKSVEELKDALLNLQLCSDISYDNKLVVEQYKTILDKIFKIPPIQGQETEEVTDNFALSAYWDYKAYESECWKKRIKEDYDKLQKNHEERIGEICVYKKWVDNLEKQKNEISFQYDNLLAQLQDINSAYEKQGKNLEDRLKELTEYKLWVDNLQNQNEAFKMQIHLLEKNNESAKSELSHAQKKYLEIQEKLKEMKNEESNKQKQVNIQLRELYNNVRNERESKLKTVTELQEQIENLENEKKDLKAVIVQFENEKMRERGIVSKTIRCLRLYGIRHTIRSCIAELRKK